MPCIVYGQPCLMKLMPGVTEPVHASSAPCFEPTPRPMSPKMRKLVLKFRRQNGRCYYQKYRTHTCNRKPRRRCVFSKPTPPVSEPHVFDLAPEADELNQRAIAAKALRNQKKHPKSPRCPRAQVVTLLKACCSCNSNRFKSASSALQGPTKGIVGRPGLPATRSNHPAIEPRAQPTAHTCGRPPKCTAQQPSRFRYRLRRREHGR